jgi:hypothetical protein
LSSRVVIVLTLSPQHARNYVHHHSAPAESADQQDAPPAQAPAAAQPQVQAAADDIDMIE